MPVGQKKDQKLQQKMTKLGIFEKDIQEQFVRAAGRGGQKVNKSSSCVVIKHIPTGIVVKCMEDRSQSMNRFLARRRLVSKIEKRILGVKSEEDKRRYKIRKQKQRRSRKAKEKILEQKRRRSILKSLRKPVQLGMILVFIMQLMRGAWAYADISADEVLVVYNSQYPGSKSLARYYQEARNIPKNQIMYVLAPMTEDVSRRTYENTIRQPICRYLEKNSLKPRIRAIVLVYGIPLRINNNRSARNLSLKTDASVDSELSLLFHDDYPLEGWVANPAHYLVAAQNQQDYPAAYIVSRIDGPDRVICEKMIANGIEAEKNGLKGNAYFDARGRGMNEKTRKLSQTYSGYDQSLRATAEMARDCGIPTTLDNREELFPEGACPEASLYCGWYSYGQYRDAFDFVPGAIAYHLASREAHSLKKGNAWCKALIEDGVSVTLGPVGEPYIGSFPLPELFFGFIFTGRFSVAEAFYLTKRSASWKMVLVGDPMYNPFKNSPVLGMDDLSALLDEFQVP